MAYTKVVQKLVKTFFVCLLFYIVLLTAVFCIPNSLVEKNVADGVAIIKQEGLHPHFFFSSAKSGGDLDNFTDKIMLEGALSQEKDFSPLKSAMSMSGYARYWHGYQVILRPLLVLFSYAGIRYLNTFFLFGLFSLCLLLFYKKLGANAALAFFLAMMSVKLFIVPMSMQLTNMLALSLVAVLFTSYYLPPKQNLTSQEIIKEYQLFFVIGSLTAFLDLLTVPLLPVGMVLVFIIIWHYQTQKRVMKIIEEFQYLLTWSMGYLLTWLSKWLVADLFYNFQVIENGLKQVSYRMGTTYIPAESLKPASRFLSFRNNFELLFSPFNNTIAMILTAFLVIGWFVLKHYYKRQFINTAFIKSLLLVNILPWLWYIVIPNHSQLHSWFTYRSQAFSVMGFIYVMLYCLDMEKTKYRDNV